MCLMILENMSEFNFKSSVCTSIEQSERLLALGLKKETADMTIHIKDDGGWYVTAEPFYEWEDDMDTIPCLEETEQILPAWSLNRLIEMMPEYIVLSGQGHYISIREHCVKYVLDGSESNYMGVWSGYTLYDKLINCIVWLIKEGNFNKLYLV